MTLPVTGIELTIGSAGVLRGRDEWTRGMQAIQTSARQTQGELQGLQRAGQQWAADHQQVRTAAQATARSFTTLTTGTINWSQSMRQLRGPLTILAGDVVGVQGPLARLVGIVGQLGVGTPVTVGVLAGIAAIGVAMRLLNRDSKEAKEGLEALLKRAQDLAAQERKQSGREAEVDLDVIGALLDQARARAESLRQVAENQETFFGRIPNATREALREANQLVARYQDAQAQFQRDLDRIREEAAERERQRQEALARKRETEHQKELARQHELQRIMTESLKIRDAMLRGEGPRPGVVGTGALPSVGGQRWLAAADALDARGGLKFSDTAKRLAFAIDQIRDAAADSAEETKRTADEERLLRLERERTIGQIRQAIDATLNLAIALDVLDQRTASALSGVVELGEGLATKNPLGVISGALKLLGSVFGDGGKAAREAAREMASAVDAFARATAAVESPMERLAREYADLVNTINTSAATMADKAGEIQRATESYRQQQAILLGQITKDASTTRQGLFARELEATGQGRAAATARLLAEQQAEFEAFLQQFRDLPEAERAALMATLEHVQALEREAVAARAAAEALQRTTELASTALGLEADLAELRGDTGLAAERRRQARDLTRELQQEIAMQEAVREGWSEAQLAQLAYIQSLQDQVDATRDATEAARALAEAQEAQAQHAASIAEREARLAGRGAEADTIRINEAARQERDKALQELQAGRVTQTAYQRWLDVIEGERGNALIGLSAPMGLQAIARGGGGAAQALTAVSSVVTDQSALLLVDLQRSEVEILRAIEINTRTGTGGGSGIVIRITNRFGADVSEADITRIVRDLERKLDEALGAQVPKQQLFSGDVGRH